MAISPPPCPHDPPPSARVSVAASGALKLNDAPSSLDAIVAELQRLQALNGTVYYYREAPQSAPHPAAERVFEVILDLHLTVMLISTPDFSEYFDNEGQSWPRDQHKRREVFHSSVAKKVRKVRMAGALLAVALGLVISATRIPTYLEANDMLARGITTEATVMQTRHWIEDTPSRRQFVHDVLVYEFTDKSGAKYRNEVDYEPRVFSPIQQGDAIRIIYKAQQPGISEQQAHYERLASLPDIVLVVLMAMGSVFGIACFIGFLLKRKLTAQLPQHFL